MKYSNVSLFNDDCINVMQTMINDGIKVDLTVTSPPYDNLRSYKGEVLWDFDKFKEMRLTEYVSEYMKTPAISESPVNIYCKVENVLSLGSHDMFIGKVLGVTVDEAYMDENGRFALEKTNLVAYSHGEYYSLGKYLGKFGYSVKKK